MYAITLPALLDIFHAKLYSRQTVKRCRFPPPPHTHPMSMDKGDYFDFFLLLKQYCDMKFVIITCKFVD